MANNCNDTVWDNTFQNIKALHNSAYKTIEEAISLEEHEKSLEALERYKDGITIIDDALAIQVTCPDELDETWNEACRMIRKLKRTRAEVLSRVNCLKSKQELNDITTTVLSERKSSKTIAAQTYIDLANALKNLELHISNGTSTIIYTHDDVKMYCISPDGVVQSTSESQPLAFFSIEGDEPYTFLQVGNWIYPLIPGVSPCYRTTFNCFIFPDVHSEVEGSSVGIVVPGNDDQIVYEFLINILHGVVIEHEPEAGISEKISSGIVKGAGYLAQGLIMGAEGIGSLLNYGTPKLINTINAAEQNAAVSPTVSSCVKFTENATSKTVQVTGFLADKVAIATSKLGQFLAPHIQKQGTRLLKSTLSYSEEDASSKMKNVLCVTAGAVEGFSTVYHGLEASAAILGQNLKDNTVKVVQHKYGVPAGDVAADTFNTVGNVFVIGRNAKVFTPKGLAKRVTKDTTKAVLVDHNFQIEPRK